MSQRPGSYPRNVIYFKRKITFFPHYFIWKMGLICIFIFLMKWCKSNMFLFNLVGTLGGEWTGIQNYFIIMSIIINSKVIWTKMGQGWFLFLWHWNPETARRGSDVMDLVEAGLRDPEPHLPFHLPTHTEDLGTALCLLGLWGDRTCVNYVSK